MGIYIINIINFYNIFITLSNMNTPEIEQQFNYETDLFRLRVSFTGDKLSFELDDLDEWVIYSK